MTRAPRDRDSVKSRVHAARMFDACRSPGDELRLRDVVERTGRSRRPCASATR
jgi:hypothetical protein